MHWALSVSSPPASEPLTTLEARDHVRQDVTDDDPILDALIVTARQHVEEFTRRALITQTLEYRIQDFRDYILLPRPPLSSVTSIQYVDLEGNTQTLPTSVYDVDTDSDPGVITRGYQQVWPAVRPVQLPVTITYVAGYGSAADVPRPIKQAMLLLLGHWYAHREAAIVGVIPSEMPQASESLLWPYRILNL